MKKIIEFIKTHKKLTIAAVIIIAVLAAVFVLEGRKEPVQVKRTEINTERLPVVSSANTLDTPTDSPSPSESPMPSESPVPSGSPMSSAIPTESPAIIASPAIAASPAPEENIQPTTAPAAEPENVIELTTENTCTVAVSCETLLANSELLNKEKRLLVPPDGFILPPEHIAFYDGESAFDVLLRTLKQKNIHMDFSYTPMYDSMYIKGINNIYEMDAGAQSGWLYSVNGATPSYSCSQYMLRDGDIVEFVYSCNQGKDVGLYRE